MNRQELVEESISLRKRAKEIKKELEIFDREDNIKKNTPLVGKCFLLLYEPDEVVRGYRRYCRVDRYDVDENRLYGIIIVINGEDIKVQTKEDWFSVEVNHLINYSCIDNGYEIPLDEFNEYVKLGLTNLKLD